MQDVMERFDEDRRLSPAQPDTIRQTVVRFHSRNAGEKSAEGEGASHAGLYRLGDGPFQIQWVRDLVLQDSLRDKPLRLRITSPDVSRCGGASSDRGGKFPTILFSHGAGGSKDGYQPLIRYWASHGYVCIQPTHGDSLSLLTREQKRGNKSLQEYVTGAHVRKHWESRPADVCFVLDWLATIEAQVPGLAGNWDKARIGMGGHSFGAHTTQLIGGVSLKSPVTGKRAVYTDERPQALLMISPQGTGQSLDQDSWKGIQRPVMVVTGSKDASPTGQPYTWRMEVFENLPVGEKYLAFIEGAHHNFGGISGVRFPGAGPNSAEHVDYVKAATLAFWDAFLKSDDVGRHFLESDQMNEVTAGAACIRSKLHGCEPYRDASARTEAKNIKCERRSSP